MEKVYDNILAACILSPICAFYDPSSNSTQLRKRLDDLFESLRSKPVKVMIPNEDPLLRTNLNYGLVDKEFARLALFKALYQPHITFLPLARALKALEEGDGRPLWELERKDDSLYRCKCNAMPVNAFIVPETMRAVACSDADPEARTTTLEELKEFYGNLANVSSFAEFWVTRLACQ